MSGGGYFSAGGYVPWRRVLLRLAAALCFVVALCVPAAGAYGQIFTIPPPDDITIEISDQRPLYRIGFLLFESDSVSRELEYLLNSLPEVFAQEFSVINDHYYRDDELEDYRRYLQLQRVQMAEQRLADLLDSRDQRAFAITNATDGAADTTAQDRQLQTARDELALTRQYDADMIEVENPKPIEIVNLVAEYPRRKPSYHSIITTHDLDMVFDGTVAQDNEFVLLTLRYYTRSDGQTIELDTVSAAQDEVGILPALLNDSLASIIVGQAWSTIIVEGVRDQDAVYLDDTLLGYGERTVRYIPFGDYVVRAESEYFDEPQLQGVSIESAEPVTVRFAEDDSQRSYIAVDSVPAGVSVYLDSTWQGVTPLSLERPPLPHTLLLRQPGYFDAKHIIDESTEERLSYALVPALFDQGEWLFSRRDRFYSALAALIISVPIPIILNGVYENSVNYQTTAAYASLPPSAQSTVTTSANIFRAGGYAGIFLSVTLAFNTIVEAVRYINAADFFHRL